MKPRLATLWLGGCSGCHMSFLDLDEFLLDLLEQVDLVYGPLVDTKEFPENVDLVLVEGAVANEDNLRMLLTVRQRSRILVSFGDCAVTGNVTALRNLLSEPFPPLEYGPEVPKLMPRVHPLHHYVKVDHYLPGCPPNATAIRQFVEALLQGQQPASGLRFG